MDKPSDFGSDIKGSNPFGSTKPTKENIRYYMSFIAFKILIAIFKVNFKNSSEF